MAGLFSVAAFHVSGREVVYPPALVQQWVLDHPDARQLESTPGIENRRDVFMTKSGRRRREDLLLLFAGLAAGCLATGLFPVLVERAGGPVMSVLVVGSVAVGGWSAVRSVTGQAERAAAGGWTLGDDALDAMAGQRAGQLRALRERIPEDHAVVVVGLDDRLLNTIAWGLHPRPIHPVFFRIDTAIGPLGMLEELQRSSLGTDSPGRWLLHVETFGLGARAPGPAALEVPR